MNGPEPTGARDTHAARDSQTAPVVDVHCHVFTPAAHELLASRYSEEQIRRHEPYDLFAGDATRTHNSTLIPSLRPKMTDPVARIEDMDRMGVDVQVLATFVSQYSYWTDPALGAELSRLQNDFVADMASSHPRRFAAIGTVPMQDTSRAIDELDRIVSDLGFKGVQISSSVNGQDYDDPRFRDFFARAEELDAVVLIHPNGFDEGRRLDDFFLINVIGNPLDSTFALTRMIFGGVLARHPRLKLCVVHGGGYVPFYWARMDHAWKVRPEARRLIDEAPSSYLSRVHFDTMVFAPEVLKSLIDFAGVDHVVLGTDYPFDMGEDDPVGLIGRVPDISDQQRALIRGGTAAKLFSL